MCHGDTHCVGGSYVALAAWVAGSADRQVCGQSCSRCCQRRCRLAAALGVRPPLGLAAVLAQAVRQRPLQAQPSACFPIGLRVVGLRSGGRLVGVQEWAFGLV